jgi:hypothetical membrane protein
VLKARKVISALILVGSVGLALFGSFSNQAERFYLAGFVGLVLFSGIWPWASSKGLKRRAGLAISASELPIVDCQSRMNRGSPGSSNDGTGIEIE